LLSEFRTFHEGKIGATLTTLREAYDLPHQGPLSTAGRRRGTGETSWHRGRRLSLLADRSSSRPHIDGRS
jgi:hypothetical protein